MEEKKCTGNCIACSFQQQTYCAAQHGHAIMTYMPAIIERLERLESKFVPADIINPLKEDKAQSEAGAENRASETINPSNNGL